MARNPKVSLVELVKKVAHNSRKPELVEDLRRIELEERRALLMRVAQIEKNWNIQR